MKITLLCPDASGNCLGRAALLAKLLRPRHTVEIVAAMLGPGLWEPLAEDDSLQCTSVALRGAFPVKGFLRLLANIRGDILYACKPLMTSFGLGLLKRLGSGRPLIIDIDDWDCAFIHEQYKGKDFLTRIRFFLRSHATPYAHNALLNAWVMEKLVGCADAVTVSNRFLQDKFGGELIWHARDTEELRPERFDRGEARERCGFPKDRKVILFLGTPRPWKGLDDLIYAVYRLHQASLLLVVVGLHDDAYCRTIKSMGHDLLGSRFLGLGMQPFPRIPEFLASADVVVIPQKKSPATLGQIPAKIFDAMAMGVPIIATAVSDIPEILEGCGWVVEPGNPRSIADALDAIFSQPQEALRRGMEARRRCIERYSLKALEEKLENLLHEVQKKRSRTGT